MCAYPPECKREIRYDHLTCGEFFSTSDNDMAIPEQRVGVECF